jgi:hypothetical protein
MLKWHDQNLIHSFSFRGVGLHGIPWMALSPGHSWNRQSLFGRGAGLAVVVVQGLANRHSFAHCRQER